MIVLQAVDLQWINDAKDEPDDQCAHAKVDFSINNTSFVETKDGVMTVSAAALYLLRTLENDSNANNSVSSGNFTFPCCAFNAWIVQEEYDLLMVGCGSGKSIDVKHGNNYVIISNQEGKREKVSYSDWQNAVVDFAKSIKSFYQQSEPKSEPIEQEEKDGWLRFWEEFNERLSKQ